MKHALLLALSITLVALPALAQPRFSCVGAEKLEDDVFSIAFPRGSATITEATRSPLAAAIEAALAAPERNICILGHAGQEGGATTSIQLAAQRARTVSNALAEHGIGAERLRAEARSAQYSPTVRAAEPPSRTVTIVLMPAP
ncbi:MAG: OmpA family protein [Roseomonas sp.]|jgi:outer membrane protein OmpA-like peptidoglycan-associated protein|nr:OmpA family protein [Roseomonas sp.]MCA3316212.1 OmpA family protein [Roseomonas sp.]MCA3318786.1 OmpA family protein [Roseomonas sp.]